MTLQPNSPIQPSNGHTRVELPAGAECQRQLDQRENGVPWWRWGPYLSERQWGTVRED
jgi:hypothetical protein